MWAALRRDDKTPQALQTQTPKTQAPKNQTPHTQTQTPKTQTPKNQTPQKHKMNNDKTLDMRELTESPGSRRDTCEPSDKRLLEREDPRYARPFRPGGLDVNLYATKKSVAQGMMDIALLTANASQLKYVLREEASRFYLLNVICIGISIALQLVVGVLLILNTRYNINLASQQSRAELVNNLTIIGIFLITVSNVFVSAFGTTPR